MNKFKPGDKVMRIGGVDFPQYNMKRGGVYTVKGCTKRSVLLLESGESFAVEYFKLVEDEFEGNI